MPNWVIIMSEYKIATASEDEIIRDFRATEKVRDNIMSTVLSWSWPKSRAINMMRIFELNADVVNLDSIDIEKVINDNISTFATRADGNSQEIRTQNFHSIFLAIPMDHENNIYYRQKDGNIADVYRRVDVQFEIKKHGETTVKSLTLKDFFDPVDKTARVISRILIFLVALFLFGGVINIISLFNLPPPDFGGEPLRIFMYEEIVGMVLIGALVRFSSSLSGFVAFIFILAILFFIIFLLIKTKATNWKKCGLYLYVEDNIKPIMDRVSLNYMLDRYNGVLFPIEYSIEAEKNKEPTAIFYAPVGCKVNMIFKMTKIVKNDNDVNDSPVIFKNVSNDSNIVQ